MPLTHIDQNSTTKGRVKSKFTKSKQKTSNALNKTKDKVAEKKNDMKEKNCIIM